MFNIKKYIDENIKYLIENNEPLKFVRSIINIKDDNKILNFNNNDIFSDNSLYFMNHYNFEKIKKYLTEEFYSFINKLNNNDDLELKYIKNVNEINLFTNKKGYFIYDDKNLFLLFSNFRSNSRISEINSDYFNSSSSEKNNLDLMKTEEIIDIIKKCIFISKKIEEILVTRENFFEIITVNLILRCFINTFFYSIKIIKKKRIEFTNVNFLKYTFLSNTEGRYIFITENFQPKKGIFNCLSYTNYLDNFMIFLDFYNLNFQIKNILLPEAIDFIKNDQFDLIEKKEFNEFKIFTGENNYYYRVKFDISKNKIVRIEYTLKRNDNIINLYYFDDKITVYFFRKDKFTLNVDEEKKKREILSNQEGPSFIFFKFKNNSYENIYYEFYKDGKKMSEDEYIKMILNNSKDKKSLFFILKYFS